MYQNCAVTISRLKCNQSAAAYAGIMQTLNGVFIYNNATKLSGITDGTSNTLPLQRTRQRQALQSPKPTASTGGATPWQPTPLFSTLYPINPFNKIRDGANGGVGIGSDGCAQSPYTDAAASFQLPAEPISASAIVRFASSKNRSVAGPTIRRPGCRPASRLAAVSTPSCPARQWASTSSSPLAVAVK